MRGRLRASLGLKPLTDGFKADDSSAAHAKKVAEAEKKAKTEDLAERIKSYVPSLMFGAGSCVMQIMPASEPHHPLPMAAALAVGSSVAVSRSPYEFVTEKLTIDLHWGAFHSRIFGRVGAIRFMAAGYEGCHSLVLRGLRSVWSLTGLRQGKRR